VVPKPATKVTLAPTQPLKILGGEQYLSQTLEGRPIMKGDLIEVSVMGRKFDLVVQSFTPSAEAGTIQNFTGVCICNFS
jgi:transitional endoplasmic reticulum ATPase